MRDVKRKTAKLSDYGVVIGTRLMPAKVQKVAALAKAKSTKLRTVRPADILRAAIDEYLERHAA